VRNRRSTQSSCVGATIFFTTWLRLNLPPPRQARWEAAPRRNAGPSPPSLPRWKAVWTQKESSTRPSHTPPSPPSLPRWKAVLTQKESLTRPSHTPPPRHRACLGGGGRAAELRAAGRAESYVPACRDPSVGWRQWLVRFLGRRMRARCAHVSKRTTGAPRNEGVLPCGLRATRIRRVRSFGRAGPNRFLQARKPLLPAALRSAPLGSTLNRF